MNGPVTYLITKGELTPDKFEQKKRDILKTVAAAIDARIAMIQIREKAITAKQLFELSLSCTDIVAGSETKLLVNGRADVAFSAGAQGAHLPEDGVPISEVRKAFPKPFLIGASVHSIESARSAKSRGADFVVFGPVFDSGEKNGQGINVLADVCGEVGDFPVIGVGGIDAGNLDEVLNAGVAGYAAIRYLNDAVVLRGIAKE